MSRQLHPVHGMHTVIGVSSGQSSPGEADVNNFVGNLAPLLGGVMHEQGQEGRCLQAQGDSCQQGRRLERCSMNSAEWKMSGWCLLWGGEAGHGRPCPALEVA
jgi:hypothetical protein